MKTTSKKQYSPSEVSLGSLSRSVMHRRTLAIAEYVLRKVETNVFIAKHSHRNNAFSIMSNVCDNYAGWLDDDRLVWTFVDGSSIGWDREHQLPYVGDEHERTLERY